MKMLGFNNRYKLPYEGLGDSQNVSYLRQIGKTDPVTGKINVPPNMPTKNYELYWDLIGQSIPPEVKALEGRVLLGTKNITPLKDKILDLDNRIRSTADPNLLQSLNMEKNKTQQLLAQAEKGRQEASLVVKDLVSKGIIASIDFDKCNNILRKFSSIQSSMYKLGSNSHIYNILEHQKSIIMSRMDNIIKDILS